MTTKGKYYDKGRISKEEGLAAYNLITQASKDQKKLIDGMIKRLELLAVDETTGELYNPTTEILNNQNSNKMPQANRNRKSDSAKKRNSNNDVNFPSGIIAFKPNGTTPRFIVASIVINPDVFIDWLENASNPTEHEEYGTQVTLELKESKDGKFYLSERKRFERE